MKGRFINGKIIIPYHSNIIGTYTALFYYSYGLTNPAEINGKGYTKKVFPRSILTDPERKEINTGTLR